MVARELIAEDIWPVRSEDTVRQAETILETAGVDMLPVVERSGRVLGLCDAGMLSEQSDAVSVGELKLRPVVAVGPEAHVYEAAARLLESGVDVIVVLDDNGTLEGILTRRSILAHLVRGLAVLKAGAVLEIEMDAKDYSIGRLVHAIEQSNVLILSLSSEISELVGGAARVTLKLNANDASRVRHMLEHYGYRVTASYNEGSTEEELQMRVQEFMRYLEV